MSKRFSLLAIALFLFATQSFSQGFGFSRYHRTPGYYEVGEKGKQARKKWYFAINLPMMKVSLDEHYIIKPEMGQKTPNIDTTFLPTSRVLDLLGLRQALTLSWPR